MCVCLLRRTSPAAEGTTQGTRVTTQGTRGTPQGIRGTTRGPTSKAAPLHLPSEAVLSSTAPMVHGLNPYSRAQPPTGTLPPTPSALPKPSSAMTAPRGGTAGIPELPL